MAERQNFENLLRSAYDLQRRQQKLGIVTTQRRLDGMREKSKHRIEIRNLAIDLILFAVPFVFPMPTTVRWSVWLICVLGFGYLVPSLVQKIQRKYRIGIAVLTGLLFSVVFANVAYSQWREEQASKDEGDLTVDNPLGSLVPMVQLADSTKAFPTPADQPLRFFPDGRMSFGLDPNGSTTVTTTVEDREGHRLAEVTNNHWQVFRDAGDKNYRKDTLEVLDRGGHVVLQLRLLRDRLVIWGEWHNEFGKAIQLTECSDPRFGEAACFKVFGPAFPEDSNKAPLKRLFEYPSKTHWGELSH